MKINVILSVIPPGRIKRFLMVMSCGCLLITFIAGSVSALTWSDESYLALDWPDRLAPLGFGLPDVLTEIEPGGTTYYFRTLFYLPSDEDYAFDTLELTVFCSDGVVVYVHSSESGRSPSLPEGPLDADTKASEPDPDGVQVFDASWLLTNCENGWGGELRSVAVEVHRVNPEDPVFSFDAQLIGYESGLPVTLLTVPSKWRYSDSGEAPVVVHVPAVGKILQPITGLPRILTSDQVLQIRVDYDPAIESWQVFLASDRIFLPLGQPDIISYEDGDVIVDMNLPVDAPPGTYDLQVLLPDKNWMDVPACVSILPSLSDELSAVHITDSHVPFRGGYRPYNYEVLLDVIDGVNKLQPDIVIHTGDGYNEGNNRDQAELFASMLPLIDAPVFYVPGNHELGEWCGTGSSRYNYWEFFGWDRLNPESPDPYPHRTRDVVVDAGSISLFFMESWVNYTDFWWQYYAMASFLDRQIDWLTEEAALRMNQNYLVACYHHDFADQMYGVLPDLKVSLSLSGHTHNHAEETYHGVLFLKTAATYGNAEPIRWLRFEDGNLDSYPIVHMNPISLEIVPEDTSKSYAVDLNSRCWESDPLNGLKAWVKMPPDSDYSVTGGDLLGTWDLPGAALLGIEYDLDAWGTTHIEIRPKDTLPNLSFWLSPSQPVYESGDMFDLSYYLTARSAPESVIAYVALYAGGQYYFWPDWTTDPEGVPINVPATGESDVSVLHFEWPDIPKQGLPLTFYAILVSPDTGQILTPLSTVILYY
jgi:predicted MPP superfamily phosphohydrolase